MLTDDIHQLVLNRSFCEKRKEKKVGTFCVFFFFKTQRVSSKTDRDILIFFALRISHYAWSSRKLPLSHIGTTWTTVSSDFLLCLYAMVLNGHQPFTIVIGLLSMGRCLRYYMVIPLGFDHLAQVNRLWLDLQHPLTQLSSWPKYWKWWCSVDLTCLWLITQILNAK